MSAFEDYWDRIICINRTERRDRWAHVVEQCRHFGLERVERFEAHEGTMQDGTFNGNHGCTASHRGVLELIAHHGWGRTLVLEDDFEILHPDFHARWESMIPEVPHNWDMLYLGGHYAEAPIVRHSPHVIRMGRMLTTSSYGITLEMARRMAPHVYGVGPIDTLYGNWHRANRCYIFDPRLMVQYTNLSDLMGKEMNNRISMEDTSHVAALDKQSASAT